MNLKNLTVALLIGGAPIGSLWAGPGHDHGDEAPTASGPSLPRFVAQSELFELVGVLDGKAITLYLDQAASNEPVTKAQLEIEMAGAKLQAVAQADGSFLVTLPQALKPSVIPVTATVSTESETDLLAGELDLHGDAAEGGHAHGADWKRFLPALAALPVLVGAFVFWVRRRKAARFGSAN